MQTGFNYPFRVIMLFLYVVFKFMFYFWLSPKGRVVALGALVALEAAEPLIN